MLALDDERWKGLDHRGWCGEQKSPVYPDSPYIPDVLKQLQANPLNSELFNDMIPYLCSEGTTWDAAYAAFPYIVELAKNVSPIERTNYLIWLGLIVIDACKIEGVEDYVRDDYIKGIKESIPLLLETLKEKNDAIETSYLLASLAAFKGFTQLGEVLANLESHSFCLECDNEIFNYQELSNQSGN